MTPRVGCEDVEEELRIASLALNAAIDSIIVHRTDGTIVLFNEAAAEHLGVTVEEFAALPPWGWTNYADPEVRKARTDAICAEGALSFRSAWRTPQGAEVWMEIHARCVESEGETLIVSVARDITEQVRATELLEHMAFHDALTGLANRASFDAAIGSAIAGVHRYGDYLGIAYLDLDDFKDINDTLGHDAGDQVLITLADRLRKFVRPDDTIARIGGDEFVILLPRLASGEELDAVARRFITLVEEPVETFGVRTSVKVSMGLALFDPETDDARSLIAKADTAMYAAKNSTEQDWLVYAEGMSEPEKAK